MSRTFYCVSSKIEHRIGEEFVFGVPINPEKKDLRLSSFAKYFLEYMLEVRIVILNRALCLIFSKSLLEMKTCEKANIRSNSFLKKFA